MLGCYLVRELHSTCCRSLQKPLISKCLETATKTTTPSKKTLTENRDAMIIKSPTSDWEVSEWNLAITTHMRNGQWESALRVFNCMPLRDSVSYNCMISGYLSNDKFDLARDMFEKMPERDMFSWNMMLNGYVKNRDLTTARAFFDQMPQRDGISWNAMLSGYAQNGYVHEARKFFDLMPFRNEISWNGLLVAYVQSGRIREAGALFQSKMDWEEASWNCLMSGYVKRKRLTDARRLFDRMPNRDVISWTTMITGYAQNGELSEARRLFEESPTRNVLTWTAMVSGYIQNGMLDEARRLFDRMPIRDEISWNTMITGYAQNGELSEALRLFEESPTRDVFTWTAMVSGYIQNGMLDEARRLFDEMPAKNEASWNAMIAGYVQCKRMDMARELFEAMPCPNKSSWNTMITGYAQNGNITQARYLFDKMPRRDCISWAAIITGYAQSGHAEEALHLFFEMKSNGEKINRSAFTCSLSACADIAALELGKQMHGWLVKAGYESDCYVGNALLAMYCKCGSIDEAYDVFDDILEKDVVSYNTMIAGYARHGFGKEALMVFESMKTVGVKPDDVTMVGVLSACNHSGLVEKGTKYFYSMDLDYGVTPNPKHYTCMIDLLGRAGRLDEAQNLMRSMPFMPDAATWGALLRASRIHGNTELGEKAAKIIFEMEPDNAGMYVLLSNLYAASGRWGDVSEMRLKMRDSGVKKEPGYSWLEAQNKIHTFSVGDHFHPDKDRIYAFLEELDLKMKLDGYVSSTKLVLHDVEEEEKEHMLKYHSEKLAVAFGILSIPAGRPIRVIKNLRVCEDCHNAIKHISKIEGRLIILRDSHRFHHFSGGSCSCGDYW